MATVTMIATARTGTLGARNVAAKRNRQYGTTRSRATTDLATYWFATRPGSIFKASEIPPRMANDSATQPAPRIRCRIHWSVVSAARRTNSTSATLDRTCVQCVTVRVLPAGHRPCRQVLQRFRHRARRARDTAGILLLALPRDDSISPLLFGRADPPLGKAPPA